MTAPDLRCCPFCANESLVVATVSDGETSTRAVICPECGACGPRASEDDPPGHVEHLWNQRFGMDH